MMKIRGKHTGFTLIELLVVIAIIAILAAILFPVFARARENARRAGCMSNLKQITLGMMQYSQDYDERLPAYNGGSTRGGVSPFYHVAIDPYVKSRQLYRCPSARDLTGATWESLQYPTYGFNGQGGSGYMYQYEGTALAEIEEPSITWMLVEQWLGKRDYYFCIRFKTRRCRQILERTSSGWE